MTATSFDLSQIKTDALASASAFRALIGLGTLATQSPTGTPSASTFLRGDFSWQTIDLSGYVPYSGATGAVNLGANEFTASRATLATGTITTSTPAINVSQTWNNAAVSFVGMSIDITKTAATLYSPIFRARQGATSLFEMRADDGVFTCGAVLVSDQGYSRYSFSTNNTNAFRADSAGFAITVGKVNLRNTSTLNWSSTTNWYDTADLILQRDAANTLAQRNDTNAQRLNLYGTYTDASNYRRLFLSSTTAGAFTLGVEGAGTGASGNTFSLSLGGTTALSIDSTGVFQVLGNAGWGYRFIGGGNSAIHNSAGLLTLRSYSGNDVVRVNDDSLSVLRVLDLTSTWNNAGTTFTAIKANVTDTASNAASLLLDLQVGGSSRVSISKNAGLSITGVNSVGSNLFAVRRASTSNPGSLFRCVSDAIYDNAGFVTFFDEWSIEKWGNSYYWSSAQSSLYRQWMVSVYDNKIKLNQNTSLEWYGADYRADTNTSDLVLRRDAAQTLAQRNGLNPQVHRIYNTFTDASNYERAKIAWESNVLRIGTEKAGTGSARALELQTDGTTRLTIGSGANHVLTLPDNASIVGGTGTIFRFRYWNSTDNSITFFDCYNTSGFATFSLGATNPRLNFGGTTSSFPAIKRNAAALNFRLADDSADCDITAKAATFTGIIDDRGASNYIYTGNSIVAIGTHGSGSMSGMALANGGGIVWTSSGGAQGGSVGLALAYDAANTLALRNAAAAQTFRVYNTFTDSSNYERAVLDWSTTSNVLRIGTEAAGTGTVRNISLVGGNVGIGTTSPAYLLDVAGPNSGEATPLRLRNLGSNANQLCSMLFSNWVLNTAAIKSKLYPGSAGGDLTFWTMNSAGGEPTQKAVIDTSGNFAIGLSTPLAKLDISDTTGAGSGSLAASILNLAQTWNTTGTPTAFKLNVTDTASNANSLLLDLQVGGTSRFRVGKNGALIGSESSIFLSSGAGQQLAGAISTNFVFSITSQATQGFRVVTTIPIGWASFTGGLDGALTAGWYQDASNAIAQRNSTNAQTFRIYNTYTDSSNYERAKIAWESNILRIGTEKAGTGSARALELQTDGTTRLTIASTGLATFSVKGVFTGAADCLTLVRTGLCSFSLGDANGDTFRIQNAGDSSDMLRIHGTTKLVTIYGNLDVGTRNVVTDTTTGTKIGTATTQKLGFWNATPIEQPTTAVGSATVASPGGGSTIKTDDTFDGYTVAQVVKALRNFGLLA